MFDDREQRIAELIAQTVKEQLAQSNPDLEVKLTNVTKNNGVELTAIAAGRNGVLANLYIDKDVHAVIDGQANIDEAATVIARMLAHEAKNETEDEAQRMCAGETYHRRAAHM